MRFQTCFVVWHGKEPVFSIDFHPSGKIATGGADNTIKIWRFNKDNPEKITVEFCANLRRHTRSVNVVRFSPNGEYLASGSDDGFIFVWKHDPNLQPQAQFGDDDDDTLSKEVWTVVSTLRGGSSEIYDLSWSPDSQYIFSGSVDNTACIWDVVQAKQVIEFREHTHYVQGVCWDPQDQYIMTQSSDQTCRVYKRKNKSIKNNSFHCVKVLKKRQINKPANALKTDAQTTDISAPTPPDAMVTDNNINNVSVDAQASKQVTDHKMFLDETVKSFFRRLSWSPEGSLLFVPTGTIKKTTANGDEDLNTTYVFSRHQLTKPIMHLPLPDKPSLIVRCNPTLFKLRPDSVFKEDMFRGLQLPYRMVYAVATQDGVLIYDTQHANAIVVSNKIHYASITDLSWSNDGYTLGISSSDGYCSFMTFDHSDLGEPLSPEELVAAMKPIEDSKAARLELQLKVKNKVKKNKENIAPITAAEASKENTALVVNILQPKKATSPIKVLDNFFRPSPTKTTPLKRKADEMDQSPSEQSGTPQPAAKKPRKITPTLITAYAPSLQAQSVVMVSNMQPQPQVAISAPIVSDSVNSGSVATPADQAVVAVAAPIVVEPVVPAPIVVENMSA